jgi:hypothetical protein
MDWEYAEMGRARITARSETWRQLAFGKLKQRLKQNWRA